MLRNGRVKATDITLLIICLMYLITYVDRVNIATAAPAMQKDLSLTHVQLGLAFSAFAYPYAFFQIAGGWLGDRLGPRLNLLVCGAVWSGATVLMGFVGGAVSLFIVRFMLGLGEGSAFPTATRALSNWLAVDRRGFAQGITHASARLGNALTPPIIALLIVATSWRWSFISVGLISFAWVAVWWWYFRDDPRDHSGVTQEEIAKLPDMKIASARPPVPWRRLLKRILPVTLTDFCYGWTLWLFLNWIPSFFLHEYHLDIKKSAVFASGVFLAGVIGDTVGGLVSDQILRKTGSISKARVTVIVVGFLGAFAFMLPVLFTKDLTTVTLALSGAFFFAELVVAPIWAVPMDIAPQHSGTASGFMNFGFGVAGMISPVFFGAIIDATGRWDLPFIASLGLLLLGAVLAFFMRPDELFVDDEDFAAAPVSSTSAAAKPIAAHDRLEAVPTAFDPTQVDAVVQRARCAQRIFADASQERADDAVRALAWSLYKPENAKALAQLAVEDTKLGNVADKIRKKQRKTFGTLRDLLRVRSVGVIERDNARGLVKYAKPIGVVCAVTPSTNPGATPVNKAMMAVKGRNAVVIAPSPLGYRTTARAVELMRAELQAVGIPSDLVQILPAPITKEATQALMRACELVVVTGSQDNVKRAYSSGTPAIGVGAGNVPVIIDETADLKAAAERICESKIFDNSTSCSSENSIVIVDEVYDRAIEALESVGGYLCDADEAGRVEERLFIKGKLNRDLIARDADVLARAFELRGDTRNTKFFMVGETGVGRAHPLSGEKLALILTVYRASDFAAAKERVREILDYQGKGHSCGLHTTNMERARELAEDLDVVRVLVNFAHTFGNGGGFNSGLNFTLSMGCGSWQKNSISENLNYRHFLNITHLVTPIAEDKPTEREMFGPHWEKTGYKEAAK